MGSWTREEIEGVITDEIKETLGKDVGKLINEHSRVICNPLKMKIVERKIIILVLNALWKLEIS